MKKLFIWFIITSMFVSCRNDDQVDKTLRFKELGFMTGDALTQATGMTASPITNSIYIVSREIFEGNYTERLVQYDIASKQADIHHIIQSDYITKNAHHDGESLIVISGLYVNVYDENNIESPVSTEHGLALSRFGSAELDGDIYSWGGDLNDETSDQVRLWNPELGKWDSIGVLPIPRFYAHGDIVNEKLYVFGGQEGFNNTPLSDLIFEFDLIDHSTKTLHLPQPSIRTFAQQVKEKIYVISHPIDDVTGKAYSTIGLFDPATGETELKDYVVDNEVDVGNIHQMTIFKGKMYILYGNPVSGELSLQVAKL